MSSLVINQMAGRSGVDDDRIGSQRTVVAGFWRKSTKSEGSEGQCVEAAALVDRGVALRDSKNVDGPMLSIAPAAWVSLLADIKGGSLDLTP